MNAIKEEIRIAAPASKVYEALTRQAGYRGWWNAAGEVSEAVGGEVKLHFVKEGQARQHALPDRRDEGERERSLDLRCQRRPELGRDDAELANQGRGGLRLGLLRT